jgi:hypothetical protein
MIEKILQIIENLKVRFGLMLVGPAMSGKTTLLSTIRETMNELHEIGK